MYSKIETESEIDDLVEMAHEIWSDHFGSMFDDETLPKLIVGAQSKEVILSQMKDGYQYFFIIQNDTKVGYFAYNIDRSIDELFLSKIYIYSSQRGHGIGKQVLHYLESICHDAGVGKITLTVYHGNISSVKAYEKWGFSNLGLIKRHFDNGLVFDDIKMEKAL